MKRPTKRRYDAIEFVEIVKDRVCDWIFMHGQRPVKPENVCITNMTFEPGFEIKAMAQYLAKPWKMYSFYIYFNFVKQEILTNVMDPYVRKNGILTRDWDGITCLEFDDKGRSYEVAREEAKIIDSYKRLKHPRPDDSFYYCSKCKNKFAKNPFDLWLDNGLKCPVCGASGESLMMFDRRSNHD